MGGIWDNIRIAPDPRSTSWVRRGQNQNPDVKIDSQLEHATWYHSGLGKSSRPGPGSPAKALLE
jgi:hypothetical protein